MQRIVSAVVRRLYAECHFFEEGPGNPEPAPPDTAKVNTETAAKKPQFGFEGLLAFSAQLFARSAEVARYELGLRSGELCAARHVGDDCPPLVRPLHVRTREVVAPATLRFEYEPSLLEIADRRAGPLLRRPSRIDRVEVDGTAAGVHQESDEHERRAAIDVTMTAPVEHPEQITPESLHVALRATRRRRKRKPSWRDAPAIA